MTDLPVSSGSEFVIYQTEDGLSRVSVRFEGDTVWLTQNQMVDLFQSSKANISEHIKHIFDEGELDAAAVVRKFRTTAADSKTYNVTHYNLDVIISVGYRVRSLLGTQFRVWATQHLREYIIKGFTLDDERLKQAGGSDYFDELLARIRDIRSSEKVFWRKVLDIYATSIDYDPRIEISQKFFKVVQNKMHWAAHGHTAAEIIAGRANASEPNMGLTSWTGMRPKKTDAEIAKNYLNSDELDSLNRIVTAYLEFAELQALNRAPMHMQDWIKKLDDFLRLSDREILTHAGKVSHDKALETARSEFDRYREQHLNDISPVEEHFLEAVEGLNPLESKKRLPGSKKNDE